MKKLTKTQNALNLNRSKRRMVQPWITTENCREKRRSANLPWPMLLVSIALAFTQGCTTNLQRPYVESMEDTRIAVEADVKAGFYKPDAMSRKTLDGWKKNNADAKAVLVAEGKWETE